MEPYIAVIAILSALLFGAMSPGPSFLVLAQTSLAHGLSEAISMTFGLALASALFGALAFQW